MTPTTKTHTPIELITTSEELIKELHSLDIFTIEDLIETWASIFNYLLLKREDVEDLLTELKDRGIILDA